MKKTIGQRIKERRKELGLTQEELAEKLYIKKNTISYYENDLVDMKVSVMMEIAKVLNTTVAYLVDGECQGLDSEVLEVAMMLQEIENQELRKVALEQMTSLIGLKTVLKLG